MTKLFATALVATMAFAGVASAATSAQIEAAQDKLDSYGFNVDAGSLSSTQVSSLLFVDEMSDDDGNAVVNEARAKTSIRAILN